MGLLYSPKLDKWRGVLISRKMVFVGEGLSTETLAVVPSAVYPEPKPKFLLTGLFSTLSHPPSMGAQNEGQ